MDLSIVFSEFARSITTAPKAFPLLAQRCEKHVLENCTLSMWAGTTALNFAVMRGDVEIVKILLDNGADPYVQNDLKMNAFDICEKAGY